MKENDIKIMFAQTSEMDRFIQENKSLVLAFFNTIIGINFYSCFISDDSTLFDFGFDEQDVTELIKQKYGIDMTVLEDGRIITVLKAIKAGPYIH